MDVNYFFSPKSQTLTLLTSSPSLSPLSSSTAALRSIRPGGRFLRPPRGRTRRKSRQLSLLHSPPRSSPLPVKASLASAPESLLIVFALTAFAALALAFFDHFLKSRNAPKKVSNSPSRELVQVDETVMNHVVEDRIVDSVVDCSGTSLRENEYSMAGESGQSFEEENALKETVLAHDGMLLTETSDSAVDDTLFSSSSDDLVSQKESQALDLPILPHVVAESGVVQLPSFAIATETFEEKNTLQETTLVHDGSLLNVTSDSAIADISISGTIDDSVSQKGSEATDLPILPHVFAESGAVQLPILATKMTEVELGKDQKENELEAEHPRVTVNINPTASSVTENDVHTEVNEQVKSHNGFVQEVELTSYLRETDKEKQYSSSGDTPLPKSAAVLNSIKVISSHASPFSSFSLSSPRRNTELKRPEVSVQDSLQTSAGYPGILTLPLY